MGTAANTFFELPDMHLAELPTGSVKTAVSILGRKIAQDEFSPNDTIPMETDLIEMLDVSRTVVREAIKVLSGKGMLRTARRYGTRILPYANWNLMDPDVIHWHDPKGPRAAKIYNDSTELRLVVEPAAAALAANNASKEQRDLILRAAKGIHPDHNGPHGMLAADYTFHSTILAGTNNVMFSQLQRLILALLQFSYSAGATAAPGVHVSQQDHIDVADAILENDPEAAQMAMLKMFNKNITVGRAMQA